MPPPRTPSRQSSDTKETSLEELKQRIHGKLVDKLDLTKVGELEGEILRREIRLVVEHLCDSEDTLLNRSEREQLVSEVLDETFGLGPLELLLKDTTISDIMINGPKNIYCERRGKMEKTSVVFRDNDHLMQIIDRIISKVGRRVDETCPMVDARMLDGSRFNAIIPPLALDGACVSIRRFGSNPLEAGRPAELQGLHARDGHAAGRGDQGPAEHHHLRRHGLRQDDAAEHAFQLHPQQRPRGDDRRRGRIAAPAGPRGAAGDAAGEHRGQRRDHGHRPREERPPHAAGTDHHRRVPRRRNLGHAAGHEHGPRGLDDHDPRQYAPRRPLPPGNLDHDVGLRSAAEGHADAGRQRREPDRAVARACKAGRARSPTSRRSAAWSRTRS